MAKKEKKVGSRTALAIIQEFTPAEKVVIKRFLTKKTAEMRLLLSPRMSKWAFKAIAERDGIDVTPELEKRLLRSAKQSFDLIMDTIAHWKKTI